MAGASGRDVGITSGNFDTNRALAINNRGQIVGVSEKIGKDLQGHDVPVKSLVWLWDKGRTTIVGSFNGYLAGSLLAINDRGQVAGSISDDAGTHGFLWQNGTLTVLPLERVAAINNSGQITGERVTRDGSEAFAVVWQDGKMRDLDTGDTRLIMAEAINDRGQIVATGATGPSTPARRSSTFVWQNGTLTDLGTPPRTEISARAINASGQVVGFIQNVHSGVSRAFLWQRGRMIKLGTLGGNWSEASRSTTKVRSSGKARH